MTVHLAHCPACGRQLEELRWVAVGIRQTLAMWDAPPDFERRVGRRIAALRRARQRWHTTVLALAAIALTALIGVSAPFIAYPAAHMVLNLAGHLLRGGRMLLGLWWGSTAMGGAVLLAIGIGIALVSWIAAREIIRRTWQSSSSPG